MLQIAEAKVEEEAGLGIMDMCTDLFREWLLDLTFEEKQVWLWNAIVDIVKIKQRREPQAA